MLRDEHGMAAVRRLPTVVERRGRREAALDDLVRVLAHRVGAADERDAALATPRGELELRAELRRVHAQV